MITLRNPLGTRSGADVVWPTVWRGRWAMLGCCAVLAASVGAGCGAARRELASPNPTPTGAASAAGVGDAAAPPAVTPRSAFALSDRATWSRHSKAGRDHLALKRYREAEEEFVIAMGVADDYEPKRQRQNTTLANLERVALRYDPSSRDLIRITRVILPIAAQLRGPSDPSVVGHLTALGQALIATDQFEEARGPLERALEIVLAQRGNESLRVGDLYVLLASLERGAGNLDAAETYLAGALEISERIAGLDDPGLAPILDAQARVLAEMGRSSEAEAAFLRARELTSQIGGLVEALALNALAQFYVDSDRPSEAEVQALRALELSAEGRVSTSQTAAILDTLGTALLRQEKYAEAEVHLARAYGLAPNFRPPFDQVREHYAQLLRADGREAEASAVEAGRDPVAKAAPTPAPAPSPAPSSADATAAVGEDVAD